MQAVLYFATTFRINILTLQIFQKKFEADEIVSALVTLRYRIAEFLVMTVKGDDGDGVVDLMSTRREVQALYQRPTGLGAWPSG